MERTLYKATVLTNDPSMTAWGWAVLTGNNIIAHGCIKTAPEHKKQRIRKSDDTYRRAVEIVQTLLSLIKKYNVKLILSESPHGSQNANAAVMIGMVTGIIVAISECQQVPTEMYSEQDSKKAALGKKSATKGDMIDKMKEIYKTPWAKNVKYIDEAVADALAVHHVAVQQSQLLKMMNR